MFKSISLKIGAMFVLLTISVIILIGTFLTDTTDRYYHDEFKKINSMVFNDEYVASLSSNIGKDGDTQKIYSSLTAFSGQLGIDSFRNIFLLDGKTGKTVNNYASNTELSLNLEISPNIIDAMSGQVGDNVLSDNDYMDYAVPLFHKNEVKYIVYVKDSMEESNSVLRNIFTIIIQALLLGIGISLVFSILLSMSIISPIKSLTNKSKKIASGDFENTIEVKSPDEIGQLTETFNNMASELKSTLSAISGEKEKVETIVQYMTDGVLACDTDGEIIHINPAAKKLLGIGEDECKNFDELFGEHEISVAQISYFKNFDALERVINRDSREISAYFAPFKNNDEVGGIVVVLRDITEREKLDKSRKDFVANVSHELRTPLTTVKSYAETLDDCLDDEQIDKEMFRSFLKTINSEADRMTRLVKDLLLLSSLDHSMKDMPMDMVDISSLTSSIVDRLTHSAKDKNQALIYEPTNKLPMIYGNSDRLEQVITNVITNAMKYTPDGGEIIVSSMYMYDSVTIKVKDNGIGIPQKDISHIFERFYRVDKARSREMGGTGLGLAIAKEIIEAHDGEISIKSSPGTGTEVMICIPAKVDDEVSD